MVTTKKIPKIYIYTKGNKKEESQNATLQKINLTQKELKEWGTKLYKTCLREHSIPELPRYSKSSA